MDEPLSNLDAKLRVGMRASLAQLHQQLGVTTVYVTHDQVEAMTLGQRVAVMRDGRILQVDTPQTLYEQPRDLFVAGLHRLAGDEPRRGDASTATRSCSGSSASRSTRRRRPRRTDGGPVILGIRPETFEDAAFASPELPTIDVEVVVLEELGSDAHVFFRVDATRDRRGDARGRGRRRDRSRRRARLAPQRARRPAHDGACRGHAPARGRPVALPLLRRRDRARRSSRPARATPSAARPPVARPEPPSWSLTSPAARLRCGA